MTEYIDRTQEPDDVFEREVLARVGDPVTAPQPATPGSDSVRAQIAEVLVKLWAEDMGEPDVAFCDIPDVLDEVLTPYLAVLVPLVDRLRAEAKAEALEEAAKKIRDLADGPVPSINDAFDAVVILRARAAAYRTKPSSEEQS